MILRVALCPFEQTYLFTIQCREALAYFHCDESATTPRAETVGDTRSFLRYVRQVLVCNLHNINHTCVCTCMHAHRTVTDN